MRVEKPDYYRVVGDAPDHDADDMCVTVAGRYRADAAYHTDPRTLAHDHVLIYTESGGGSVRAGSERAVATAGDLMLLLPGVEHEYQSSGPTWRLSWFHVRGTRVGEILGEGAALRWIPPAPCRAEAGVPHLLARILDELETRQLHFARAVEALAQSILIELVRAHRARAAHVDTTGEFLVHQVNEYILRHLDHPLSISQLADDLHVSTRHLARLFHRHVGQSPKKYVLRVKIAEAKRLLLSTDLAVSEVALRVGFGDTKHFSRVFKQRTDQSPQAFRIALRSEARFR